MSVRARADWSAQQNILYRENRISVPTVMRWRNHCFARLARRLALVQNLDSTSIHSFFCLNML